ncbi:mRNA decay activator protein ZFP36 [Brachyhypopomus gauderio]|uniref:mRNA decay activator protein ZFP36 n=1 Tax=Brachyhypopomus gauderio TaxID=698409 RepID=UPI004042A27B
MSDTYDDIIRNLINIGLNDHFPREQEKPILQRPPSIFSPKCISSERLSEESLGWPFDIWSEDAPSKPSFPFRSDRSMSLTDGYLPKTKTPEVPPPPGFPPLAPQPSNRYKTELCRSFQENGSCKYGSKCQFAHGESELRCLNRHPKYKTEACRTFYNFGYCPYGARCHFIHEEKICVKTLNQKTNAHAGHNPRLLRQSVSFAGFLGSRSMSPPLPYEPVGFARAPSVSPPPTDLLSPVFSDTSREMFPFPRGRTSEGDVHSIPSMVEPPKSSSCVCGQGNNFPSSLNKCVGKENRTYMTQSIMQRFPSDDSLSDRDSYSSTGSTSGSESPTFDGSSNKRLTVFARMSVSD